MTKIKTMVAKKESKNPQGRNDSRKGRRDGINHPKDEHLHDLRVKARHSLIKSLAKPCRNTPF